MRFTILATLVALLFAVAAMAAESGYTDYIMAIKEPADDAKIKQARADVESCGGKVNYEVKYGLKALIVSIPDAQVSTFDAKDYIDFMEKDQEVHTSK
ncbi:hypothetical protein VTP01DRAFT_6965 [Rhizomucor pusillus]|uniref:uncharacterized protein n=1 Tax=Rhizomucor pusillus TaxID=4840 RepID=UPI003742A306